MKDNFEMDLDTGEYWSALKKIEGNISKGRFSQRLASDLIAELIPKYINDGIATIIKKVK